MPLKKTSPWSIALANYEKCQNCSGVRKYQLMASSCPFCSYKSNSHGTYFHLNIMVLLDLLEESYKVHPESTDKSRPDSKNVNIILIFSALKEALLENLLANLMEHLELQASVRDRLADDNRLFGEKINKLFPALAGSKWEETVALIDIDSEYDYIGVSDAMKETGRLRNNFLHTGSAWSIGANEADYCIGNLREMIDLFVSIHNHLILKFK